MRMRRYAALLIVPLLFAAVGCSSDDSKKEADPAASSTSTPGSTPGSTEKPVELAVSAAPSGANPTTTGAGTGQILMVKVFVDDMAAGEKFYGTVFGATLSMSMGENVHMLTLPAGGPGLVLIKRGPEDADKYTAFIVKVPDMKASEALALANGGKHQQSFTGAPGGQGAQSIDLLDPFGNQVEVLQMG